MQWDVQTLTSFEKFDMVVVELETGLQKSLHPAILGVHGISLENMENMEKMENINQKTWNTWFMIQNTLFLNQNTLIVNQMTQNIQVYSIYGDG